MADHKAKPKRKTRYLKGGHMDREHLIAVHPGQDQWHLYCYYWPGYGNGYAKCKLAAGDRAANKANYWFSVFPNTGYAWPNRDMAILRERIPDLDQWTRSVLTRLHVGKGEDGFAKASPEERGRLVAETLGSEGVEASEDHSEADIGDLLG